MRNITLFTKFKQLDIRSSKFFQLSCFCIVLLLFVQMQAFAADRGRPHLDNSMGFNRLLTDKNTLLRGVSLAWDGGDNAHLTDPPVMPTQDQLNALYQVYGVNTIHVYLEMDAPIPPDNRMQVVGHNAAICDQLVDMAAKANLYVIITIGCGNNNGNIYSMDWCIRFWNFYAPRYANRTHVIYESHNEPAPNTPSQWKTSDWDNQVTLYNTIRAKAPNTHILTCTFMGFTSPSVALQGIGYMRWKGVDFSNASVAFHGYENQSAIQACIREFKYDRGGGITPALLCTEFDNGTTYTTKFNNMLESENVGWLQFTFLRASMGDMEWFKGAMRDNNVVWTPDYMISDAPVGQTIWLQNSGKFVSSNNGGAPVTCDRQSVEGWEKFDVVDAGNGKVALKGTNGLYLSSENGLAAMKCNRIPCGDWEKFEWVKLGSQVALKGNNGRFVSSENGAITGMNCNRESYSGWEVFNWGTTLKSASVNTFTENLPVTNNLYPNPFTNELYLNNSGEATSITIYDLSGKLITSQDLSSGTNSIDITSLEKGIYIAKINNVDNVQIIKILKK
jgi:hypothetical protein